MSPADAEVTGEAGLSGAIVSVRQRYRLVLAIVGLAAACFAAYALLATPIYRATTVLVPASQNRAMGTGSGALGQLAGLASLTGISLDARDAGTEEALAVLQSQEFGERFITSHGLLPKIFRSKWDAAAGKWDVSPARVPTLAKGYRYFSERMLAVGRDRKTGLITVSIDWRDRQESAAWTNELVDLVNAEMRRRAIATATANTEFLEKERERTSFVETRDAINRLMQTQIQQRMIASVSPEYSFRVVDRALVPDVEDFVWPQRVLLIVLGPLVGLFVAIFVVLGAATLARVGIRPGPPAGRQP